MHSWDNCFAVFYACFAISMEIFWRNSGAAYFSLNRKVYVVALLSEFIEFDNLNR